MCSNLLIVIDLFINPKVAYINSIQPDLFFALQSRIAGACSLFSFSLPNGCFYKVDLHKSNVLNFVILFQTGIKMYRY